MDPLHRIVAGEDDNPFALSIGDLMSALLLVFILLLSAVLLRVKNIEDDIVTLAEEYDALQDSLYQDLQEEFGDDLERWSAELTDSTLSIRFKEPEVLFAAGQASLRPLFSEILQDFFPRYINLLRRPEYIDRIEEIRIEGHTSSEWAVGFAPEQSYFLNMELSQDRTRSVLRYVLGTLDDEAVRAWTQRLITANGLSSSKPILVAGIEDPEASRRVEFRVRTDAEKQLAEILDQLHGSRFVRSP
jgi:outer membrane protein OmpA-like peptidoglycan-associated protein